MEIHRRDREAASQLHLNECMFAHYTILLELISIRHICDVQDSGTEWYRKHCIFHLVFVFATLFEQFVNKNTSGKYRKISANDYSILQINDLKVINY